MRPTRLLKMRRSGWTPCLLSLGSLLLTGCVTAPREPVKPVVTVKCGRVLPVTRAQQTQAADELDALPDDSVIANVIVPDWQKMRDEARACKRAGP